jgi:catechol 2,3-dioxygenase-like lactoylglutathione lyase family enzyme
MALVDHLGMSVVDFDRALTQFGAVFTALGYEFGGADDHSAAWHQGDETELIIFQAREPGDLHRHGESGWQHLAFAMDSREDVERLHRVALDAGWSEVRAPKPYPRFNERYYASFVEDPSGIRLEFMHNPPRAA